LGPEEGFWGAENMAGNERYTGDRQLDNPLGTVQMGLIYVKGLMEARSERCGSIRETFGPGDERRRQLRSLPGHTFGKAHGCRSDQYGGVGPEGSHRGARLRLEEQLGSGNDAQTISSGLEGAWTTNPVKWDNNYFENLFGYEWELAKSPAGAYQWTPKNGAAAGTVPDAHDPSKRHAPMMFTTDLALRMDPIYEPISRRYFENPQEFADAFSKAWYKLTHRDMGPISRYLGPLVPAEPLLWQDPVPAVDLN
jgi:catalase-peroxidase